VYTAIQVIEGRWKPMICRRLGESGALGFGELRQAMPGVTAKVLRQQLRQMEAAGLVAKSANIMPLRVQYRLTPHGRTLGPVFELASVTGATQAQLPSSNGVPSWSDHRCSMPRSVSGRRTSHFAPSGMLRQAVASPSGIVNATAQF
jgi:DNA-binding HxlR family transcriptional regulator